MIDDRIYTVTAINGFRRGSLTREAAIALAKRMNEQMREAGWSGNARVWYRDGTEVIYEVLD